MLTHHGGGVDSDSQYYWVTAVYNLPVHTVRYIHSPTSQSCEERFDGFLLKWKLRVRITAEASIVLYAYNPSTLETEAGGSPVSGQPGPHSETLSQNREY
jgi:hypothetical protein